MDWAIVIGAFRLVAALCVPLLGAVVLGAIVAGTFRVVTQIDDPSIGLAGRVFGFFVLLSVGAKWWLDDVVRFAARIWTGTDTYW